MDPTPPSELPARPTLLIKADLERPRKLPLSHGTAAAISRKHPGHDSPNQDAAAVITTVNSGSLLVIADGMGGTRQGGEAAATVVRQLASTLKAVSDDSPLRTSILNGIEQANQRVIADLPGSGSTLAAVEISGHTIRPYHVGDSEILVVGQRGKVKLLTISHSPVGLGVGAGLLDAEEALHHEERHIVLNAVGSPDMRIELGAPLELDRHDTVLLASDGLTDNLSLDEIIEVIRKGPLGKSLLRLASLAAERMAGTTEGHPSKPDDLSLIAYRRTD